jgi:pectate lyase
MRPSKSFALAAVLAVVAATDVTTSANQQGDLGREVLAPNDGWASEGSGTTGGVWLDIRGSATDPRTNLIIRNITFEDTFDCFPAWAPTDGASGSWNSQYDSISTRETHHVWIDHNTFRDRTTADTTLPNVFGVLFQVHDGLLDITNASNFVTVSWNRFENHDKLMLIGSSNDAPADVGKLRVTLHHNLFDGIGQRAPRVRFGQVHVYNNHYEVGAVENYQYSWGVGIQSQIYAENNFFEIDDDITLDRVIERLDGTAMFETGTLVNGKSDHSAVSMLEAYNAVNDPDIQEAAPPAGWTPTLHLEIDDTKKVLDIVKQGAGPFKK